MPAPVAVDRGILRRLGRSAGIDVQADARLQVRILQALGVQHRGERLQAGIVGLRIGGRPFARHDGGQPDVRIVRFVPAEVQFDEDVLVPGIGTPHGQELARLGRPHVELAEQLVGVGDGVAVGVPEVQGVAALPIVTDVLLLGTRANPPFELASQAVLVGIVTREPGVVADQTERADGAERHPFGSQQIHVVFQVLVKRCDHHGAVVDVPPEDLAVAVQKIEPRIVRLAVGQRQQRQCLVLAQALVLADGGAEGNAVEDQSSVLPDRARALSRGAGGAQDEPVDGGPGGSEDQPCVQISSTIVVHRHLVRRAVRAGVRPQEMKDGIGAGRQVVGPEHHLMIFLQTDLDVDHEAGRVFPGVALRRRIAVVADEDSRRRMASDHRGQKGEKQDGET